MLRRGATGTAIEPSDDGVVIAKETDPKGAPAVAESGRRHNDCEELAPLNVEGSGARQAGPDRGPRLEGPVAAKENAVAQVGGGRSVREQGQIGGGKPRRTGNEGDPIPLGEKVGPPREVLLKRRREGDVVGEAFDRIRGGDKSPEEGATSGEHLTGVGEEADEAEKVPLGARATTGQSRDGLQRASKLVGGEGSRHGDGVQLDAKEGEAGASRLSFVGVAGKPEVAGDGLEEREGGGEGAGGFHHEEIVQVVEQGSDTSGLRGPMEKLGEDVVEEWG